MPDAPKTTNLVKSEKSVAKRKKAEILKFDGFNDADKKNVRRVLRQAWSWSFSRKLVEKRCALPNGYAKCEQCKKKVPKVFIDHIKAIGVVDAGFLMRLFVPSNQMQGLCKICHSLKTKTDNAKTRKTKAKTKTESFL